MDEVYVVEIAATGPKGMPSDTVVQIGICRMLADGSDFDTVYDATVAATSTPSTTPPWRWTPRTWGRNPSTT